MLCLTRKPSEHIALETTDGLILVTITEVRGEKVRLGIEAPLAVKILRSELRETENAADGAK